MNDTRDDVLTPAELLKRLGETHVGSMAAPTPDDGLALGYKMLATALAAGFARTLHALNEVAPEKAAELADWYDGPFGDGPNPCEVREWILRHVADSDPQVLERWERLARPDADR